MQGSGSGGEQGGGARGAPPPRRPAAAVAETHISTLFFYGDRVYKVRKPVAFGFVDFTDIGRRRADCEREVALNRRLAPDVYLGTATVTLDDEVVEHAVVMRRLPTDRNLEHLVAAGRPVATELHRVATELAAFHRRARRSPEADATASAGALRARWLAVGADLAPYVGPVVDADRYRELTDLALGYLAGRAPLLESRVAGGRIVDGHGDLQAADVFCMDDGPRILDCLEFDDRLRYGDGLADVTFLVADLERLGAPAMGESLLAAYRDATGDRPPRSLVDFYVAARAHVRVLVECLRRTDAAERADAADRLLGIATDHARRAAVRLVLVGGPPGAGKTALATWLGEHTGAVVLSTDAVREELGLPRGDERRYTERQRGAVYERMCRRAGEELGMGRSVVLDGTWGMRRWRDLAAATAEAAAAGLCELQCRCPPGLRATRVADRPASAPGTSEVTPAVAGALADSADPWPTARTVDCSGTVAAAGRAALGALASSPRAGRREARAVPGAR